MVADIIRDKLYGKEVKDLTEAEKENISALTQLATGLATVASTGGDLNATGTAVAAGKNAVENNRLTTNSEDKRIDELAQNDERERLLYQAAACALIKCSAEFADDDPMKAVYQQLEILGNSDELQTYRDILNQQTETKIGYVSTYLTGGSVVTYETLNKLFEYTGYDEFSDSMSKFNGDYSITTRAGGVLQLGFGLAEMGGGIVLAPTCSTGLGCIASGTVIWLGADSASTGLSVVIDGKSYTMHTAKSLSNLLNISENDAELLFAATSTAASWKAGQTLINSGIRSTGKLSAKEIDKLKNQVTELTENLNKVENTIIKESNVIEQGGKELASVEKNGILNTGSDLIPKGHLPSKAGGVITETESILPSNPTHSIVDNVITTEPVAIGQGGQVLVGAEKGTIGTIVKNSDGLHEVKINATSLEGQGRLNTPDLGGSGKLKPAEAASAAQLESSLGKMERYTPSLGAAADKTPDFIITSGPNKGKTVDAMYTTDRLSQKEIDGLNKFYEKNMNSGAGQKVIQDHLMKADYVPVDFRVLTPANQKIFINYIKTLPKSQQDKIIIMR
ncbi:VENN motif pre-toxin domain-containing protein [Orbaceae bacterium ac157xtp]